MKKYWEIMQQIEKEVEEIDRHLLQVKKEEEGGEREYGDE
jgi:Mg2+ and Co2+ transporter CorA